MSEINIENLMELASINEVCRDSEYKKKFLKILDGKRFVWNWAAFFCTPLWAIYRKIYWLAFLSALLSPFIYAIWVIAAIWIPINIAFFGTILIWAVCLILLGGYGNYLYYKHLGGKIQKSYHLIPNIKNIDKTSGWLFFLCPLLGLISGIITYTRDRLKVKTYEGNKTQ